MDMILRLELQESFPDAIALDGTDFLAPSLPTIGQLVTGTLSGSNLAWWVVNIVLQLLVIKKARSRKALIKLMAMSDSVFIAGNHIYVSLPLQVREDSSESVYDMDPYADHLNDLAFKGNVYVRFGDRDIITEGLDANATFASYLKAK